MYIYIHTHKLNTCMDDMLFRIRKKNNFLQNNQ